MSWRGLAATFELGVEPPVSTWLGLTADWWGAAGQWAGAIGTVWAVVVALSAGRRAQKLRDQDRRAQDLAHINLISFEVKVADDRSHARVTIANDSLEPVRGVSVYEVFEKDGSRTQPRYVFRPGHGKEDPKRVLRAGGSVSFLVDFLERVNGRPTLWPADSVVSVGWVDARGKNWHLDNSGEVMEVMSRASEWPTPPPWWKTRWWDPWWESPWAPWLKRQRFKWGRRGRVFVAFFGAWWDRIRRKPVRKRPD